MKEFMKKRSAMFILGFTSAIIIMLVYTYFTSYEKNVRLMSDTLIQYNHESEYKYLSPHVLHYLIYGKKVYYFGSLSPEDTAIVINSPYRATLYIYPCDEDSFYVRYEPRNGTNRTYKSSGFGDFNRILLRLYELTGNEVFNVTVEYDK